MIIFQGQHSQGYKEDGEVWIRGQYVGEGIVTNFLFRGEKFSQWLVSPGTGAGAASPGGSRR